MPPWFIIGGAAVFAFLLAQAGKLRDGEREDTAAGSELPGGAGDGGGGGGGGLGDLPGWLPLQDAQQPPQAEQYGFGESYSDGGDGAQYAPGDYGYDYFGTPIPPENVSQPYGGYYGAPLNPGVIDIYSQIPSSLGGGAPSGPTQPTSTAPAPEIVRSASGKPILMD